MPRKPREEESDAIHHVYARGNDGRAVFRDDVDRESYLGRLARVVRAVEWRCLAYCLMDNHVHLLVETPRANVGAGVQQLHGPYAQTFQARHGGSGHLFQGRFGSTRVTTDAQLLVVARYIALNPVTAGVCARPGDWPWSSHTATAARLATAPAWLDVGRLLSYFGATGGDARQTYANFVADT